MPPEHLITTTQGITAAEGTPAAASSAAATTEAAVPASDVTEKNQAAATSVKPIDEISEATGTAWSQSAIALERIEQR